jgi:F-type H+-transporting ATPase subunit delta
MKHHLVARRYAKALFHLARDRGEVDAVWADITGLLDLHQRSADFRMLLEHPLMPPDRRRAALDQLSRGRLNEITGRFLGLLEEKRRLSLLPDIGEAFRGLWYEHQGRLRAFVSSAHPLAPAQAESITERIGRRWGRRVEATFTVDPGLVGGFRVQVGDHIVDASVTAQLERAKHQLIHAG